MTANPTSLWYYIDNGTTIRTAVRVHGCVSEMMREQLLQMMRKLPRIRREPVPSLEKNGARVLDATREKAPVYPWTVRLYYESMGGEQLAAEFGGLTEAEARSIAATRDADVWGGRPTRSEKCPGPPEKWTVAPQLAGKPCTSERWCLCDGHGYVMPQPPRVRRDARIVVMPSELRTHRPLACEDNGDGTVTWRTPCE